MMSLICKRAAALSLLFLSAAVSFAQSMYECTPAQVVSESARAFDSGERLDFDIQYKCLGIRSDVGTASIVLSESRRRDGRRVFHAVASGATAKFFDRFFMVRDLFESSFYVDNGRPFYFHRDVHEGDYTMINYHYWNNGSDDIWARTVRMGVVKDTLLHGRPCTYDLISLFYTARNIDYRKVTKGKNYPLSFSIDDEVYDIYFRYEGDEVKKVPGLGTFSTMKFACMVISGEVFNGDSELYMWISNDRNKIPLWIESPIRVGSVVGKLKSYSNLKHPLTSKISD